MSPRRGVAPLRRAAIVRATIRCLARDGYSGLTMKRVAREAKVSQGILHYYFRDKRTILVAALETVAADLDRRVAAAQSRGGKDARARLLTLVEACLRLAVEGSLQTRPRDRPVHRPDPDSALARRDPTLERIERRPRTRTSPQGLRIAAPNDGVQLGFGGAAPGGDQSRQPAASASSSSIRVPN